MTLVKTIKERPWEPRAINPKCEVILEEHASGIRILCFKPAVLCYPAWGGGFMSLCEEHGEKHRNSRGTCSIRHLVMEGFEMAK